MTSDDRSIIHDAELMPPKFLPMTPNKDELSRLGRFARWTNTNGYSWVNPDLSAYRDHLLETLSPRSVKAHLSTVRKALQRVARDRDFLYEVAATLAPEGTAKLDLKPIVQFAAIIDPGCARKNVLIEPLWNVVTGKQDRMFLWKDNQVAKVCANENGFVIDSFYKSILMKNSSKFYEYTSVFVIVDTHHGLIIAAN